MFSTDSEFKFGGQKLYGAKRIGFTEEANPTFLIDAYTTPVHPTDPRRGSMMTTLCISPLNYRKSSPDYSYKPYAMVEGTWFRVNDENDQQTIIRCDDNVFLDKLADEFRRQELFAADLRPGRWVEWKNGMGPDAPRLRGEIVEVVLPKKLPQSTKQFIGKFDWMTYIVRVGKRLYRPLASLEPDVPGATREDGSIKCSVCNSLYYLHPDAYEYRNSYCMAYLHRLCDGRLVRL